MIELVQGNAVIELASRPAKSLDMIYSDPPFNTGQQWTAKNGSFNDRWARSEVTERGWAAFHEHNAAAAKLVSVASASDPRLHAYLGMMADLLLACRRSLKLTGTLWLHFDDHAGSHLRLLLEAIFGIENQLGTLIWKRSSGASVTRAFQRIHDTIAVFARSPAARYRLWRIGHLHGCPVGNVWSSFHDMVDPDRFLPLAPGASERVDYPTQKPVSLISHFIELATLPGDTVCDPTMGSGTTLVACESLGRNGLGIDLSADAVSGARGRIKRAPKKQFDLFGAAA